MSSSQTPNTERPPSLWSILFSLPRTAGEVFNGFTAAWLSSSELRRHPRDLVWNEGAVKSIVCQLDKAVEDYHRLRKGLTSKAGVRSKALQAERSLNELSSSDHLLIQRINETVLEANRSNITRTLAYLTLYEEYPEIHWALLAHMVSRNAGWNMTDLKGELMSDLMDSRFKEHMYRFLERSNALIFQDAYPQLLLYKHSREQKRSCFHLLPYFHISAFMKPFWERFWMDRNSSLLTVALIINEQNYIEGRVIGNPFFQENVLKRPFLRLHELSRLNQVIFPLGSNNCRHDMFKESILPLRPLTGIVIHHFAELCSRIKAGKTLYAMLFGYEAVFEGVLQFVHSSPHLGSREEYWPALFACRPNNAMEPSTGNAELLEWEWLGNGSRLYSPRLDQVWQDTEYEAIPRYDWFQDTSMLKHLTKPVRPFLFDMTYAHRSALEKVSIAHNLLM